MAASARAHVYSKHKETPKNPNLPPALKETYHFDVVSDSPLPFPLPEKLVVEDQSTTYLLSTIPSSASSENDNNNVIKLQFRHAVTTPAENILLHKFLAFMSRPEPVKCRTGVIYLPSGTIYLLPPETHDQIVPGMVIHALYHPGVPSSTTTATTTPPSTSSSPPLLPNPELRRRGLTGAGGPSREPPVTQVHPNYLETMRQAHDWMFGALAELIDNSHDANCSNIWITSVQAGSEKALVVTDDGIGMTHEALVEMLKIGHEPPKDDGRRIGRFGVGAKHGLMRLCKDAVIFTRSKETYSVGFLSRTYHEKEQFKTVICPIATWRVRDMGRHPEVTSQTELDTCMSAITKCTSFVNIPQILAQFGEIQSVTGTRVVLFRIDKHLLIDEEVKDIYQSSDIVISARKPEDGKFIRHRPYEVSHDIPPDYSFRAYLSMIHLLPRWKDYDMPHMFIHKEKIIPFAWKAKLKKLKNYRNFDEWLLKTGNLTEEEKKLKRRSFERVVVSFGVIEEEKKRNNWGIHIFWRNRVIEVFRRFGGQATGARLVGVVGVVDTTPLTEIIPQHNKQSFQETPHWNMLQDWLAVCQEEYYDSVLNPAQKIAKEPEFNWIQCSSCSKWRKVPENIFIEQSKKSTLWYCWQNPDPKYQKCEDEEFPWRLNGEAEIADPNQRVSNASSKQGTGTRGKKTSSAAKASHTTDATPTPTRKRIRQQKKKIPVIKIESDDEDIPALETVVGPAAKRVAQTAKREPDPEKK